MALLGTNADMNKNDFLYLSSDPEQISWCNQAREIASADSLYPRQFSFEVLVDVLRVYHLNGTNSPYTVLICPTIPRIYLRAFQNSNFQNVIKIMEERNEYMDKQYVFIPEVVHFIQRIGDYDEEIKVTFQTTQIFGFPTLESAGRLPYLVYRDHLQRRAMCIAAKKHFHLVPLKIISDTWVEKAEKYEIQLFEGQTPTVVAAFPCNSEPKFYLHDHHERSKYEIMVTISSEWLPSTSSTGMADVVYLND